MRINNDINSLSPSFRKKFDPRRAEVKWKYPNAQVFEARRSQERQAFLYAQWRTRPGKIVTWTLTSKHKDWNAVDVVFDDENWNPKWSWPYDDLIEMAKKYGIRNLKPKETCHFEDDWKPFTPFEKKMTEEEISLQLQAYLSLNRVTHKKLTDPKFQKVRDALAELSKQIRELGYEQK
jgi:peptidoglycan L-alanyl-D-glutamate endopeptidase CwlK